MSHASASATCRSQKLACELYPSRVVCLCLDPYCGLGFVLWVLSSVYSGHQSILIPPAEIEANPALWLTALSQYKGRRCQRCDHFLKFSEFRIFDVIKQTESKLKKHQNIEIEFTVLEIEPFLVLFRTV